MNKVEIEDLSLKGVALTDRVLKLREAYFKAIPEVCPERPRLLTRFHLDNRLFDGDRISVLDKARAYRYALENREPVVWFDGAYDKENKRFSFVDESLFAGSTTSRFKGVPLYPEYMALAMWPELNSLPKRAQNPYHITEDEAAELNLDIFPHWLDRSILETGRARAVAEGAAGEAALNGMNLLQHMVFFLASKPNCISHTIPDFSKAVKVGLRHVIGEANERAATALDQKKKDLYLAMAEALEGIIAYSRNLAGKARDLAGRESDPRRKNEIEELARIHERVPEYPAKTFREGLTTVWLCWIAVHLENANVGMSLGRLDQLLYDLYRSDIQSGALTVDDAVELVSCLWLKIGDHVPTVPEAAEQLFGGSGSNQAITIGGVDTQGNDAVNDLTYVMLRATELMMLRDPNLNARYMEGVNSTEYLERIASANINTRSTPAVHNDKAVIKALTDRGETVEQARDYGVVGCVEPCSNGRHYGHSGSLLLNLTSALELTLYNGRHRHTGLDKIVSIQTGDTSAFHSFDDLKAAFEKQASWLIDTGVTLNNYLGKVHQDIFPSPILSALFEGPMEKGMDLIDGGAVINSSGATFIGLADVCDSLAAIRKWVFGEKALSLSQMLAAMDADFAGHEALQAKLMNPDKTPKYGNEDPVSMEVVDWVTKYLSDALASKKNYRGGAYRLGYWTMTNHAGFGRLMKAIPSGRKARENFTSGITPVSGVTPELTKTLNSVAAIPPERLANGIALNIKFTPQGDKQKMAQTLAQTIGGYFDASGPGGMEIQFNVTGHEEFADAASYQGADLPKKYDELLVRVSGYTAYFKDLNVQMKKEIIDRTEYNLATGAAVDYPPFPLPRAKEK